MHRATLLLLFSLLVVAVGTVSMLCNGNVLYIDAENGNDDDPQCGITKAHPCASLARVLHSNFLLDSIVMSPGNYTGPKNCALNLTSSVRIIGESATSTTSSTSYSPYDYVIISCHNATTPINASIFTITTVSNLTDPPDSILFALRNVFIHDAPYGVIAANLPFSGVISLELDSCHFSHNTAGSAQQYGGAVYCNNCFNITITNCKFSHNSADQEGGAIYLGGSSHVTIENSIFESNNAANCGGAIALYRTTNANIRNCSFENNSAKEQTYDAGGVNVILSSSSSSASGGAIYLSSVTGLNISNCTFLANLVHQKSVGASYGGAIYMENSNNNTVRNCQFSNNSVLAYDSGDEEGGAIMMFASESNEFHECSFQGNMGVFGGALRVAHGSRYNLFKGCSFKWNRATSIYYANYGGAISILGGSDSNLFLDCILEQNSADYGQGGALDIFECSNNTFRNCVFVQNTASIGRFGGGAAFIDSSNGTLFDSCLFASNINPYGSALYYFKSYNNAVVNSVFNNNAAYEDCGLPKGGAIFYDNSSNNTAVNSIFQNNSAIYGGAVFSDAQSDFNTFVECIFRNNNGFSGGAIMLQLSGGNNITNCTFEANIANHHPDCIVDQPENHSWFNCVTQGCRFINSCSPVINCSNNGECLSNGSCACDNGDSMGYWDGERCDRCQANYYGENCNIFCNDVITCNGRGLCDSHGQCECTMFHKGRNCTQFNTLLLIAIVSTSVAVIASTLVCAGVSVSLRYTFPKIKRTAVLIFTIIRNRRLRESPFAQKLLISQLSESSDLFQAADDRSLGATRQRFQKSPWVIRSNEIEVKEKIGFGSFGVVYRGVLRGNTPVAIKMLKSQSMLQSLDEASIDNFIAEITLWSKLNHPSIVRFMGACWEDDNICVVSEFMENGNLDEVFLRKLLRCWNQRIAICANIAMGMADLHSQVPPILHRDLKSQNVLLDRNLVAKITDFGVSKIFTDANQTQTLVGTPSWMAPEVIRGEKSGTASDVYSFAIIMWQILTENRKPFAEDDDVGVISSVHFKIAQEGYRPRIPPIENLVHFHAQCRERGISPPPQQQQPNIVYRTPSSHRSPSPSSMMTPIGSRRQHSQQHRVGGGGGAGAGVDREEEVDENTPLARSSAAAIVVADDNDNNNNHIRSIGSSSSACDFGTATPSSPQQLLEPSSLFATELARQEAREVIAQYIDLMKRCWAQDPARRPTFTEILAELNSLKTDSI